MASTSCHVGEARAVRDRRVLQRVAGDDRDERRPDAERRERRPLADPAEERVEGDDPRPRRNRPLVGGRGGAQRDRHERELAVPEAGLVGVERRAPRAAPPRAPSRGAVARASRARARWRGRARRPCRSPGRAPRGAMRAAAGCGPPCATRPRPRPAASEATVRMTSSAMPSANGFGLRERRLSRQWVIASTPVAAVTAGGQADRELGVEDRDPRQHRRVADVPLAAGGLVGDHAIGVRLGARARGRRHGDQRQAREQLLAVVAQGEHVPAVDRVERDRLAPSPSTTRRRPRPRPPASSRTGASAWLPRRIDAAPGFGSTSAWTWAVMPPASSTSRTRAGDAGPRRRLGP